MFFTLTGRRGRPRGLLNLSGVRFWAENRTQPPRSCT
nr:MAG TPA: hypothetical protein [Caudoviricetes sp.]